MIRIGLFQQQSACWHLCHLLFFFQCFLPGQFTTVLPSVSHDTKDVNQHPERRMTHALFAQNCPSEYIWVSSCLPVSLCWNRTDVVWSKELPVRQSVLIQNSPLEERSPRVSFCSPPLMYFLESSLKPYRRSSRGQRHSIALCAACHVVLQVSTLITYSVTAEMDGFFQFFSCVGPL